MSNALALFDNTQHLPAHVGSFLDQNSNIIDLNKVPVLSYQGKVWATIVNGEKLQMMKRDADGEEVPMSVMRVIILAYGARRSRAYYEGSYDPDNISAPKCWSDDGVTPHADVPEKPAKTCASCQWSAKGSKISDNGKAVTACSQMRMLAVVPAAQPDFTPLRLKLAITSDYDAKSPEHAAKGWFAFSQFTDLLRSRGVKHTAALVVKMKFDGDAEYPKVLFSPDRWLTPEELATVGPLTTDADVLALLKTTYTPAPGEPVAVHDEDEAPAAPAAPVAAPKPAPKAKPAPAAPAAPAAKPAKAKAAPVADDDDEDEVPVVVAKPAKAKAAPVAVVDDDEDEAPAPKAKAKAAPAAAVSTDVPADLAGLLEDWGDE